MFGWKGTRIPDENGELASDTQPRVEYLIASEQRNIEIVEDAVAASSFSAVVTLVPVSTPEPTTPEPTTEPTQGTTDDGGGGTSLITIVLIVLVAIVLVVAVFLIVVIVVLLFRRRKRSDEKR